MREKYQQQKGMIFGWTEFLSLADDQSQKKQLKAEVNSRVAKQNPGNCCNIVYTSGTTGLPKGVMLSHDNMLYNITLVYRSMKEYLDLSRDGTEKMVSYLPLSHSASQCSDLIFPMLGHVTLTFA